MQSTVNFPAVEMTIFNEIHVFCDIFVIFSPNKIVRIRKNCLLEAVQNLCLNKNENKVCNPCLTISMGSKLLERV